MIFRIIYRCSIHFRYTQLELWLVVLILDFFFCNCNSKTLKCMCACVSVGKGKNVAHIEMPVEILYETMIFLRMNLKFWLSLCVSITSSNVKSRNSSIINREWFHNFRVIRYNFGESAETSFMRTLPMRFNWIVWSFNKLTEIEMNNLIKWPASRKLYQSTDKEIV